MPPKKNPPATKPTPKLSFEQALVQLEELVSKLEGGKLGLADSLQAYQQGVAHLQQCYQLLEQAELRIAQVSAVDADGRPRLEPYEDASDGAEDADDLARKASSRSQRRTAGGGRSASGGHGTANKDSLF